MKICKTINNIKVFAKQRNYTVRYKTVEVVPNFNGYTNILTQDMINEENVKYVLKYDFDLENATITVPLNCCLEFDGGSIKHGTIIGQDTFINNVGGVADIFGLGIDKQGTWREVGDGSVKPGELANYYTKSELDTGEGKRPTVNEVEQMISDIPNDVDDHLDATSVNPVQNKVVKAAIDNIHAGADKEYNPAEFSGLGKVYLKKNIVEVGSVEKNILTQSAFYKDGTQTPNTNTVFVIQYDFDLNGQTINIPARCMLEFDGGNISNGLLVSNNTIITGTFNNSINSLFGVFYDENMNAMGWDKNVVRDWKGQVEFGNFVHDIEPGEYFGLNQSMTMNGQYYFVFFVQGSTVAIVLYDRDYNYCGYTILNRSSHANGVTVCGDYIYIATSSNVETTVESESIHKVLVSDIISNCQYNKGKNRNVARTTTISGIISLGYACHGIDYDSVTETFAVMGSGYKIYSKSQFENYQAGVVEPIRISTHNYRGDVLERETIQQDIVYQNGVIYTFDWDKTYSVDNPQSGTKKDNTSNGGVCYVIDVATDTTVCALPLRHNIIINEVEGVCKDPSSGLIYTSSNNHNYSRLDPVFSVACWTYNNAPVSRNNRQPINDKHWINKGTGDIVWINNSYKGISCGSRNFPYKTIGEALVMAGNGTNRIEFALEYTGIDYYAYRINFTDAELRIYGGSTGGTEQNPIFPVLNTVMAFRHCTVSLHQLHVKPYGTHPTASYALDVNQFSNVYLTKSRYTVVAGSTVNRNIVVNTGVTLRIAGITFENEKEFTSHIVINGLGSNINISGVTVNDGAIVNTGDGIVDKNNHVTFADLENVHLVGANSLLVFSRFKDVNAVYLGPVDSIEQLELVKSMLIRWSTPETEGEEPVVLNTVNPQSVYIWLSNNLNIDGGWMVRGYYYNDISTDDEGNTIVVFRSVSDSRHYNGIVSGSSAARPDAAKMLRGTPYFDATLGKPLWSFGADGWIDADGYSVDEVRYMSDGVNLIAGSAAPVLLSDQTRAADGKWRKTLSTAEVAPSVVDVSFDYLPAVEKGFKFNEEAEPAYRDIAYEAILGKGIYCLSCWVKGSGKVKLQIGGESFVSTERIIDNTDYKLISFVFTVDNTLILNGMTSIYLGFYANEDSSVTICAPKLEKGCMPSLWRADADPSAATLLGLMPQEPETQTNEENNENNNENN